MTEYVEKQEDWMAPNGWGQRLSVQGVRYQTGLFPAAGCPGGLLHLWPGMSGRVQRNLGPDGCD